LSGLTKTFIVLHVVLSLMLAAGLIVFINRTENFKDSLKDQKQAVALAKTEAGNAKADASNWRAQTDAARLARDAAVADKIQTVASLNNDIATLKGQLAANDSTIKINAVTGDNLTAALTASEAQRTALGASLASTRTDYDTSVKKVSDLNTAISDLTNRLEVATRKMTDFQEQLAEERSSNQRLTALVKDMGGTVNGPTGLQGGAPSINAVILATNNQNGIPLATISVGSDDQVKPGMQFQIINDKNFLGVLTIETVDQQSATGKLEGPKVSSIRTGDQAKTQL
jgi:hypothetical protein